MPISNEEVIPYVGPEVVREIEELAQMLRKRFGFTGAED